MLMFKTSSPGALLKHAAFRKVRICWWLVLQDQRLESQKTNGIERGGVDYMYIYIPIPSMYAIFPYIWLVYMVNVGKYTIHGWYGIYRICIYSPIPHAYIAYAYNFP